MRSPEAIVFANNAAAGTYNLPTGAGPGAGGIDGGRYLVLLDCTGVPSLQVQVQNISGNWVNVGAAFTTSGGGSFEVALPPGQVRITVGTSTANTVTLVRIPND